MNTRMMSDQVLLNHYLAGNRSAISQLIERHSRRVKEYIRMMVKEEELAEDIFQETFIKAVRVIDDGRYVDNGKFLSWVMRIAHNQVIDHFRSKKQSRELNEKEAGFDLFSTIRLEEMSSEEQIEREEMRQQIKRLVELLPEEQREVVRLRYYLGLSFKEIAEQTEVSINTALGRMRYALINLRRLIKEQNLTLA